VSLPDKSRSPGDVLATTVWNICIEGEKRGWVSGLPPDARQRLDAAVDAYCEAEAAIHALRAASTGSDS
jgi:hypothetical protein